MLLLQGVATKEGMHRQVMGALQNALKPPIASCMGGCTVLRKHTTMTCHAALLSAAKPALASWAAATMLYIGCLKSMLLLLLLLLGTPLLLLLLPVAAHSTPRTLSGCVTTTSATSAWRRSRQVRLAACCLPAAGCEA